ncbi:VRR-NUC domain-containing protein [Alkalibacter rhizosphaerae]|uniref:VRR-NUC domain-containing protein n=1 Tax=Alkalibacter rhizosphaerae TaxID=2815577 RepID=UPI002867B3C5|nr:VRR-NUC domain-containing protein [Alkalibacter rhizosphaerae]
MTEKELELMLVKEVKKRGGRAFKFISPGINGVPDRLVLLKGGKTGFVEVKAPGKKMRPNQIKRKGELESLGFLVYCLDNPEEIASVLDGIEKYVGNEGVFRIDKNDGTYGIKGGNRLDELETEGGDKFVGSNLAKR